MCVSLPSSQQASPKSHSLNHWRQAGRREAQLGPTTVTPERCVAVPPLLLSLLSPGSRVGPRRPTLRRQTRRRWKPRNARDDERCGAIDGAAAAVATLQKAAESEWFELRGRRNRSGPGLGEETASGPGTTGYWVRGHGAPLTTIVAPI